MIKPARSSALRTGPILAALALTTLALPARGEDDVDKILSNQRWREGSFGVSLRPPLGTQLQTRNIDDAILRVTKDDTYTISVYLKQLAPNQEMTIDQVVKSAIDQFGFAQPTSAIDHQRVAKPAGRPGWMIYFGVNLPHKDLKPDAGKKDPEVVEAMMKAARVQYETAERLRDPKIGRDIDAYRLYKAIAQNSPDKVIAKKAKGWVDAYEVDRGFMGRYLQDVVARQRRNPHDVDLKAWYMGQAIMQLAPNAFVIVQLEVGKDAYEATKPIFEAVVKSMEVQNPEEMDKQRKELLKKGEALGDVLTHKRLLEALLPPVVVPIVDDEGKPAGSKPLRLQYMRVVEDGKDVGWMKTVHRERRDHIRTIGSKVVIDPKTNKQKTIRVSVPAEGVNGIGVDVYLRIHFGPRAVDSHTQTFLSEDGGFESWSIRTTVRDRVDADPNAPKSKTALPTKQPEKPKIGPDGKPILPPPHYITRTWLETGVQNGEQITIVREGPTGIDRVSWRRPDGYISQTELYLLAPLLPQKNAEYGFYAYYPNTGNITFRTLKVVPDGSADAGFRTYSRAALDAPEQVTRYDSKGGILQRALGEGRDVVPTTREELAKIWKVELPDDTAAPAAPEEDKPLPPTTGRIPR